ncbi:MAG TPA: hypothetical protein VJ824_11865 [Bacillota bacterium]|nr:hypothetical protein [Bacillota bacterium]
MALNEINETPFHDMPPEIIERLMNDHHMSWLSLSSGFRLQEDAAPTFRQPDFAAWIKMD